MSFSSVPGSLIDDVNNLQMMLSLDGSEVSSLFDITAGTNITFDSAQGRVDFFEGTNYAAGSFRDGPIGSPSSTLVIPGRFLRVTPVPLPAALPLFGSALAMLGIVGWRRRRQAA